MSRAPRWGYTGLLLGVFAAFGVWFLHQVGWLTTWNGAFYDRALSWTAQWRDAEPKVLLVRVEHGDHWSEEEAIKALEIFESLGAEAIGINFLPYRGSLEFYERSARMGNVVFGRRLRSDPRNPDRLGLEDWPAAARDLELPWGIVGLPQSVRGVYRFQQATVTTDSSVYPALEMRMANAWNSATAERGINGSFLIDFVGEPGKLPNVSFSRVLAGELIPEMVKGKAVLIGEDDGLVGLETPVGGGAEKMTFLEFQGNALHTLLQGTAIRPLPWGWSLFLLTGLGVVSSLVLQRVHSPGGLRWVLGVVLAGAVATVAALWLFRIWIPFGALVLAQAGQFGLTLLFRTRLTNRALNEMRLRSLNRIKERFCSRTPEQSEDHWDHVVSMINQMLEVSRMAFLERVPKTQRMQCVKAVGCRFEDFREKERTLDAPVFAVALAKGGPVRVSKFLPDGAEHQEEYLCPLIYAGEVLGIWVLGMDPGRAAAIPQLEGVLNKFSQQIARQLYQKERAEPKLSLTERLGEWFSREKEDQAHRELASTADVLEQHYDMLEAVLGQVSTAMIAYDFFGRVLKANEPALALLEAENFSPARATALDFLRLVTGMDEARARDLLRNVLLDRETASISIKLAAHAERQFLLRVFPLSDLRQERVTRDNADVRGVVCELIETTLLSTLANLRGVVADRLGVELRDHLAAIEISATLLETDEFAPADRQALLEALHLKTDACVQVIGECQKYLGRSVDAYAINCFPLDALELLARACSAAGTKALERRITLAVDQPRLMDQVMASTTELTEFFTSALDLLIKDAAENTAVSIQVEDAGLTSVFRLSNCGFGIPNERLQTMLDSRETPGSEEFQVLRDAAGRVRNWGGELEITSEVGRGYCIVLQLRQFKLAKLAPVKPAQGESAVS